MKTFLVAIGCVAFCLGCSDENKGRILPKDLQVEDTIPDQAVDQTPDIVSDLPEPDVEPDSPAQDAVAEAATDAIADGAGDLAPDLTDAAGDAVISAPIWGYVTRTATPVLDGKGPLYVGAYMGFIPVQLAKVQVVDMSAAGAKVKYEIWGLGEGTYTIGAFLDDNSNAFSAIPLPDPGDLTLSTLADVKVVTGASVNHDLVLDKVEGAAGPDGGTPFGSLKGTITASTTPQLDGKGAIHVTVHSQLPPAGLVTAASVANADLSSPYNSASYFVGGIAPGNYYLRAFLDDNGNVNPFAIEPDSGDLIHSDPIQVHVVVGVNNVQDVELDQVK